MKNETGLKAERAALKREMRERGIKRTSCFNGGLDADTYRFNARLFELETLIEREAKEDAQRAKDALDTILPCPADMPWFSGPEL